MKRMAWFFLSNLALVFVLTCAFHFFAFDLYASVAQFIWIFIVISTASLFCAYCAFLISKQKAKQLLATRLIGKPRNPMEDWLLATVEKQALQAGIRSPRIGIYDEVDINAFASGISQSMIAVSSGMLCFMPRDETEAVLGHEISHLAHHDMPKLIMYQGMLNLGLFYLSLLLAYSFGEVFRSLLGDFALLLTMLGAELVLSVLMALLLMHFSRQLEFRADAGGATLSKREAMIAALERLSGEHCLSMSGKMAVFGIKGSLGSGVKRLFMSHPSLRERIKLLKRGY
jgi:heat shock protein HtpX